MLGAYQSFGVNPGRSGYDLCLVGGDLVQSTRELLTDFFGGDSPERLCFTGNASDALNILIQGMVQPGDHVISTNVEHNSVIRPLNHLQEKGIIRVDYVTCGSDCFIDPEDIRGKIRVDTSLVVINHGSNVVGTIQPIAEIGRICREHELLFLVDTAQTAGVVPVDVEKMNIDALAFTGHKSMLAPTGIGGLYVRKGVTVHPTRFGGTGVRSAHPFHLEEYPYRLEVGTLNVLGIAGLYYSQRYLKKRGIDAIYRHEMDLFKRLQNGIQELKGLSLHGTRNISNRLPVLSLTVEGLDPADVGIFLDVDHDVACRTGLQCAPLIHDFLGTSPRGTVRLSLGPMNNKEDIDSAIKAMEEIVSGLPRKTA
jgi:cysteine desulfurase family protein